MATFISPTRSIVGTMAGNLYVRLTVDPADFTHGLADATNEMESATAQWRGKLNTFASAMTTVIGATLAYSVYEFAKFNDAMTQSLSIMGNVSDGMKEKLEQSAIDLSTHSIQSATDLAKAYYYLASQGFNAEQSLAALPVVAQFATAGMFDMQKAVQLLTNSQSALGLKTDDVTVNMQNMVAVSDVLNKANILADASTEQFAEALSNKAAASMRAFKIPMTEGVAVLAAFANQGIKGNLAGNQFAIMIRDLTMAALKNADVFKAFGIQVYDSQGNLRNMADIIADLTKVFATLPAEETRAGLEMLGLQQRSLGAILPLLGTADAVRQFETALENAGGTTQEISEKQLTSFVSKLKETYHQVQATAIGLGAEFAPAIVQVMNSFNNALKSLDEYNKQTNALGTTINAVSFLLKGFLIGLATIFTILQSLASLLAGDATMAIAQFSIGINTVIQLFNVWVESIGLILQSLKDLADMASSVGSVMADVLSGNFKKAAVDAKLAQDAWANSVEGIVSAMADAAVKSYDIISNAASDWLQNAVDQGSLILDEWKTQWTNLAGFIDKIMSPTAKDWQQNLQNNALTSASANAAIKNAQLAAASANKTATVVNSPADIMIRSRMASSAIDKLYEQQGNNSALPRGGAAAYQNENAKIANIPGFATQTQYALQLKQAKDFLQKLKPIGEGEVQLAKDVQAKKLQAIKDANQRIFLIEMAQAKDMAGLYENATGQMADAIGSLVGKSSGAYKVMFDLSKVFSIAQASLSISTAIAQAWADPSSLTIYQKLATVAAVISGTATIIADISSIAFTGMASGGSVLGGTPYMVGEQGPELFVPNQNGSIVPNNRLGAGGTSVVINNYSGAAVSSRESNNAQGRMIEIAVEKAKNDIVSEINQGRGKVPRALENSYRVRRGSQ